MQTIHVIVLNSFGALLAIGTLIGLTNPQKSPHKAISGLYYRAISSLFVPRFVKNAVWAVDDDEIEWRVIQCESEARSVDNSSVSDSAISTLSSDVKSFRIPDAALASGHRRRRYAKSLGPESTKKNVSSGRIRSSRKGTSLVSGCATLEGRSAFTARSKEGSRASSIQSDPPSGVCTPSNPSPIRRSIKNKINSQWQPKMSRIVSGQELDSLSTAETVAMRLQSLPENTMDECPLSPAASIESTNSFSKSVSDYVDSWLQSLKSGLVTPSEDEGHPQLRRSSVDIHGAHRHYAHGSTAADEPLVASTLQKYALESQMYARSVPAGNNDAVCEDISAINSIGLDGDCPDAIRQCIKDEHLIQFGDLIDEKPCSKILEELSMAKACDSDHALFGAAEIQTPWEKSSCGSNDVLTMTAERKPLRHGLFMYKTVIRIRGVDPHDVRPFHLDDQARSLWDESCISCERDTPPGETRVSRHAESCLHRYVSRFPRPLSARSYQYARRVWTRPSDGGCYAISKSCALPSGDGNTKKYVLVKEYISACRIRRIQEGTEISTVYFEDSQVRPGLAKMAVPKGLWPFWSKYETSLRVFAKAKQVNHGRRSLDLQQEVNATRDSSSEYDSDDEVYDALARLKATKRHRSSSSRSSASGAQDIPRWIRRVLVAGALKLIHESLSGKQ